MKEREQNKEYIYGTHPVIEALRQNRRKLHCLHYKADATYKPNKELIALAKQQDCKINLVNSSFAIINQIHAYLNAIFIFELESKRFHSRKTA